MKPDLPTISVLIIFISFIMFVLITEAKFEKCLAGKEIVISGLYVTCQINMDKRNEK